MINKIIFDEVNLSFNELHLFKNLSLEIHAGKVIAITGRNGSGKSTFLKLAGQFIPPDSGTVTAFEHETAIKKMDFRKNIAAVAPTMNLYERMTPLENLKFFTQFRDVILIEEYIYKIFDRLGLDANCKDKFVSSFSTGMKQRLKFAILLTVDADVWLLDEPCSNLDSAGKTIVFNEIQRAAAEGKIVLIATNDKEEEELANEIINLPTH